MLAMLRALVYGALWLALAGGAQAAVLYNNLAQTPGGQDPVANDGPQYNSFSTDATGTVDSINLLLSNGGSPNPSGVVEVDLFDSVANAPSTLVRMLGDVSDTGVSGTPSIIAFDSLGLNLTPDSRYWISLSDVTDPADGATSIQWSYAADASGLHVAGEYWGATGFGFWANTDWPMPYAMCVSTISSGLGSCEDPPSPVPEPATISVLACALVGLCLGLRSRRSG